MKKILFIALIVTSVFADISDCKKFKEKAKWLVDSAENRVEQSNVYGSNSTKSLQVANVRASLAVVYQMKYELCLKTKG